ncbi:endogenous retrovirus group K member 25 Pol protein-like protein [Turdus rufiventris]|nr:endogenous retrovirus group K member 25 Pol protein-like protein [Turdus rufiventris]
MPKLPKLPDTLSGYRGQSQRPKQLWQTDMTYFLSFGKSKYVHVSVDMFSGAIFTSAHAGEKATHVIKHLFSFATLGIPKKIKTNNGPAYKSQELKRFLNERGIEHNKGIPENPTRQSIVERTHQTLKRVLNQQQRDTEILSLVERLCKALYVIDFLNYTVLELDPPYSDNSQIQPKLSSRINHQCW